MMRRGFLLFALIASIVCVCGIAVAPPAAAQNYDEGASDVDDPLAPLEGAGMALVEEDAPAAPPEAADPEPAPEDLVPATISRITFDVPFAPEEGGGSARGSAGNLEYVGEDRIIASGAVEFSYQNVKLLAERVSVDLKGKVVEAEGNIILDEGPSRMTGQRLVYDLDSRTGTVYDAQAFVDPDAFFTGSEISKVADQVYTIEHGTITACSENKTPDWSFRFGKARVNMEGFARIQNATMRVKKMPFLYAPYMLFPARRDRRSGFLFPNLGYSGVRGEQLGLAYYQTLGNSYDATLFADIYGEDFFGLGAEFRYTPTHTTRGRMMFQSIDDADPEEGTRWKASLDHTSDRLPFGMRAVVRYRDFSDFNFFRDFERSFNSVSLAQVRSSGFVTGNWGSHSVNILVDQFERLLGGSRKITLRQLPELEYRMRQTRLGRTPLYLELLSSASLLEVGLAGTASDLDENYTRADFLPTLTLPLSPAPWLSFEVRAASRSTLYGKSLNDAQDGFVDESLSRTVSSASAQLIGPSFSRVFDKEIGRFGKFKHIIEPRWQYLFVDEFEDQERVPIFDEVDIVRDQEVFVFSLVNRLLAKPADPESLEGAREILSFELSQAFSRRDDQPILQSRDGELTSKSGPIAARLRYNPGQRTSLELRTNYDTLFNKIESASLLGSSRFGQHALSLSWVIREDTELEDTRTHQARLGTSFQLVRNRLRLDSQINYDILRSFLQQQRHVLSYTSQCFGLRLEWRELASQIRKTEDIRLSISLKNIGTFLDLNSGNSERFN